MELNKVSLSDSVVSSASIPQVHNSVESVNVWKLNNNSCEDSGYHSLRNFTSADLYVSDAAHVHQNTQEVVTMQLNDDRELFQSANLHAKNHDEKLISRSTCFSCMHHRPVPSNAYSHGHDMKQTDLDSNANHIHSDTHYHPLHMPFCQSGGVYEMCSCTNCYHTAVSNINTTPSKQQYSCQVANCNCKKLEHHHSSKSHLYAGDHLAHASNDFKSETNDLAEKIEFCLLFGYTVNQIRHVIFKLGYKASKNDILAELSSMQNNVRSSSVGDLTSPESSPESSQGESSDQHGDLVPRGADPGVDADVIHSHMIINDDDDKDEDTKDVDDDSKNLRPIVIDGSNVAMSHGNKQYFSCKGILLSVNYFRNRGHTDITVFVPKYRKEASRHDTPIKDREILTELEKERIVVFTPSRNINGKRVTCYDDRFVLKLAQETNAVIVSNDNFRDLQNERPEWKTLVEKRLLMYSFVNDRFMPPDDPLGRNGPNIDNFLRIRPASEEQSKPQCPYGKKCTYGKKCKFFHPECPRPMSEKIVGKKSDNNRKKSKFSLALAAELIQRSEQNQAPSTSANSTSQQNASLENVSPSVHYQYHHNMDVNAHKQMALSKEAHHAQGGHARLSLMHDVAHSQPCFSTPDSLSGQFRQLSVSNHGMVQHQQSNSMCCGTGQAKAHMCFDPHCQRGSMGNSKPRASPNHPRPKPGPPDFHADHNKLNFQRSSPANLQQAHGARSAGNPLVQQQQWNAAGPYQTNPHMPAQFTLPPYSIYQPRVVDAPFPPNQSQPAVSAHVLRSYPMPPHSHGPPSMPHYMGAQVYGPVNASTGSNNSLSRSFPYIPSSERMVDPLIQQNYGSASSHSDPHGYSFRSNLSSRQHHQHGAPPERASQSQGRLPHAASAAEAPLSSESNPRFYLYRNLCGLFQRPVVEAVMKAHPDIKEPKKIISLIQQMIE